jgi:hypothetical protein
MQLSMARLLAPALVAAALLVAGCGDDDDESTTAGASGVTGATGAAETKEQWIATADEVCANADEEIDRAAQRAGVTADATPAQLADFAESSVIPIQQSVVDTLRGLAPPEGEEDEIGTILAAVQDGIDAVEEDPEILADPKAADEEFADASTLAEEYGLEVCGE